MRRTAQLQGPALLLSAALLLGGCGPLYEQPSVDELKAEGSIRFEGVEIRDEGEAGLLLETRLTARDAVYLVLFAVFSLTIPAAVALAARELIRKRRRHLSMSGALAVPGLGLFALMAWLLASLGGTHYRSEIDLTRRELRIGETSFWGLFAEEQRIGFDEVEALQVQWYWRKGPDSIYLVALYRGGQRILFDADGDSGILGPMEALRDYLGERAGLPVREQSKSYW
jgi:hypothetical protein